ncbi:MAG: CBS domain-containing protein [Candidatus Omnitrophica bacterium]|nr:CBS domain-containing protein [Candidatus Omnitrophota bacterium]
MTEETKGPQIENIKAKDIMTEHVEVIKEDTSIQQLAHLMLRARVGGYPIVDKDGKLVGIVTLSDLFILIDKMVKQQTSDYISGKEETLHEKIKRLKDKPVKDIMSKNVIAITPETTMAEIVEAVVKWNIHTFPVMDKGKLVGIIGRHDVLNATFVYG